MTATEPTRGLPQMPTWQPRGRTLRWRREQLTAAGFDELSAHRLAARENVDIHELVLRRESPYGDRPEDSIE